MHKTERTITQHGPTEEDMVRNRSAWTRLWMRAMLFWPYHRLLAILVFVFLSSQFLNAWPIRKHYYLYSFLTFVVAFNLLAPAYTLRRIFRKIGHHPQPRKGGAILEPDETCKRE
jgi:hypothetical protein